MITQQPVILVKNLTKIYRTDDIETPALRGINLELPEDSFAAIAGPSGSGKSTLLYLLGGLLRPTSGEIWVRGFCITSDNFYLPDYRLKMVSFIFQNYNLMPALTVLENIEYTLVLQGVKSAKRRKQAIEILERVGLKKYASRLPIHLSGGEQQRVAVARAIVSNPSIILADEPTANLDSKTAMSLIDLMKELNRERHIVFFFATHDEAILKEAGVVFRIKDGAIQ